MKIKDKKELMAKGEKELIKSLKEAKGALFDLKLEKAQNKLKNTRQIFWKRKEIAWIMSALKERQITNQIAKEKEEDK